MKFIEVCSRLADMEISFCTIAIAVPWAGIGIGTGLPLLSGVICIGTESSLLSCSRFIGIPSCSLSASAGVVCPSCKLCTCILDVSHDGCMYFEFK